MRKFWQLLEFNVPQVCRKSWISFRSGVCNRFQDVAAKKVTSSHYSQRRESVALLDCGMHVVGCSWKQDQVISRGMQGACAGSGMLERAGRMQLVCAGCSDVYYFIWCYYYYPLLAHSGGCGEWDCAPPLLRPAVTAGHPQQCSSCEKNESCA